MGRKISLTLLFSLAVMLLFPQSAYADVAPPEYPPGATVGTEFETNVQMVSEAVFITIEASDETVSDRDGLATNHIIGRVEATFNMVNHGTETESFEVWFPLTAPDGFFGISEIGNFAAWVNEQPVETGRVDVSEDRTRATWEVTFPPGETVVLRVTYDLYPTGYSPYGRFSYTLETGAGWTGSISQGTVTVIMPYPINRFNLLQNPDMIGSPNPPGYVIDGNTLVWEFTDLEPTGADNISLTVLEPGRWLRIAEAEANTAANPDSVEAHLELARARVGALSFKYGMDPIGDSAELSNLARSDYEQAIALDPQNVENRVEYLSLLNRLWFPLEPTMDWDSIYTNLKEAYSIDPNNQPLIDITENILYDLEAALEAYPDDTALQAMYDDIQSWSTNPPVADTPEPTAEQQMTTPVPPTLLPTPPPEPQATAVPTPVPPSPVPTSTPIAVQTRRICPGAAVLLLVPLGLVWRRRRE